VKTITPSFMAGVTRRVPLVDLAKAIEAQALVPLRRSFIF